MPDRARPNPVAIVGMGCRFPGGVDSPGQFWKLLCEGTDAVTEIPEHRFDLEELFDADPAAPGKIYTRWGGFVDGIGEFDADFFGIAPREARRMDPQQRLLLEVVWEALEDGGQPPHALAGTNAGVYVGISGHDYSDIQLLARDRHRIDAHLNSGSAASIAANRVSYLLDLRGPSLAVDTACSSSLTAVHLACRSLAAGECDLAIAGGVGMLLTPEVTIGFCKSSMLSPDGRCRAFDAHANGYVRSEGAGAVALKPLERALSERDPIHAVILGTAINQDGRTTGISFPSAAAQEEMIGRALDEAGVRPSDVHYVEAHGTGTAAGDPVEAEAIGRALAAGRAADDPCLIGSAKTNLGHLEAASGIVGLIKAALAVKHRRIPPSLHFSGPNPAIPFDELRLRVATTLEPWPADAEPARAGVNSFGFGGANAHVVLEAPPQPAARVREGEAAPTDGRDEVEHRSEDREGLEHRTRVPSPQLLVLSARHPEALRELARRQSRRIDEDPSISLQDLCFTAAVRRSHHPERLTLVADARSEFVRQLDAFVAGEEHPGVAVGSARGSEDAKLAFVFPGMGPQSWGMGRRLFDEEPVFRGKLEEVEGLLRPFADWSLLEELAAEENTSRVGEAWLAHPANFAIQVAAAALWRSWGIVPDAIVGHSSGEMAAACVAGALSLPDAARLAFHRGRLQHRATGAGRMLAAAMSAEEAERAVAGHADRISLAAINSPTSVTLAGEVEVLEGIARELTREERFARFLPVDVPYHGPQMDPLRDEFLEVAEELFPGPPYIPLASTVTGDWVDGQKLDAGYWWSNVRRPVRFAAAVDRLVGEGCETFVEVGPHPVLAASLGECMGSEGTTPTVLPSLRRGEDDREVMLRSLAALYVRGRPVNWEAVHPHGTCVALPAYPWQREHYWFDSDGEGAPALRPAGVDTGHPLLGRRVSSPRPSWETNLDDPRADYLDEHIVQGSAVFPGAAYVEMILAAARDHLGPAPVSVEEVEFRKLLFLHRPRSSVVQTLYNELDASVEIHSGTGDDALSWTAHTTARLNPHPSGEAGERLDLPALRERCRNRMPIEEHYEMFERRAYRFGQAFHTLQEIWLGPNEALARVGFPSEVELPVDSYQVHPALLDAALQLFGTVRVRSAASPRDEAPFFPVSIRRLVHRRNPGDRFWAFVTVRHKDDPVLWNGDAWLMDDTGEVCIALEGLRLKVLDEDQSPARAEADDALYELVWEEAALETAAEATPRRSVHPVRPTAEVKEVVEASGAPPEEKEEVAWYLETGEPTFNRVARGFASAALGSLGWPAGRHPGEAAHEAPGIAPDHRRLFAALMRRHGESEQGPQDPASLHRVLDELIASHPEYGAEAELLRRGGDRLTEILRGDLDAREVLLAGESLELLSRLYHESPASRDYHVLLADAVSAAIGQNGSDARLRVLEIGAGTGAATAAVLPRLPTSVEYVFTDISPYFLAQAREREADHPGLRFSVLDIEKDPIAQGYEPRSFDLVLAANVVHTTRELRATLAHIRELLAPGGMILLLELTRQSAWFNLVFGLLDGWWRFADADLRPDHPLLAPGQWRSLLTECGFDDPSSLFEGSKEDGHIQSVILAHAPGATSREPSDGAPHPETRHWLIFADEAGVGAAIAEALGRSGDRATLVHPGSAYCRREDGGFDLPPTDVEASSRLLREVGGDDLPHGVLHFWSLNAPEGGGGDTAALMDAQELACGSVLALIQALERIRVRAFEGHSLDESAPELSPAEERSTYAHSPELWLVTSGAQPVSGSDTAPNVAQAPLWGLGRVLVSEHGGIRCRLVDLDPAAPVEGIDALAAELRGGGHDDELALRGGTRLVRRLRRVSLERRARRGGLRLMSPEDDSFRLEVAVPGAIESLQLRETSVREPGAGELSIRVRASGLNFRDVLQSLDMLPPAAFQYDPDPDGLGIECAGVVLACGEGTGEFRPGDEVVSLAGAAHASRVVARADLTAPKPPNLSFEEAASILNAFITVEYALNQVTEVAAGDRILIHSASGAVGLAAIQHCRRTGAEVFATAGSPEKREYLRSLGVGLVMDSRSLSWADEVLEHTDGEGVDVILNSLSGEAIAKGLSVLRPYGRFIELGKRDIFQNAQLGLLPFQRNLSFHAVDLIQLALDRPEQANRLIRQVVDKVADGSVSLVPYTGFDLAEAEQAFRLMANARHIGKVVLTLGSESYQVRTREEAPLFRPDATYLITGGLGGFGLAVAQWMVREGGARSIVLMSRSGVPKDNGAALEALRASPARVSIERGDVGREEDVRRILERIEDELPPLKGVVHAAMVLDDDALLDLDQERFRKVLEPKVAGAWNLHRLTRETPLDLFVLFSSMAAVIGHPMQGNYAAGNAFLDSLAAHRQGVGLPALSVGWGVVSEVGFVSRHPSIAQHLDRAGLEASTPEEALATLGRLLRHELPHVIAARMEWRKWSGINTLAGASRRFQRFVAAADSEEVPEASGDSPLARLRDAAPGERVALMEAYLVPRVARVLGTTPEKVPPQRPLTELGFDSLMAVELVTGIHNDLEVRLQVVRILEGTSTRELADTLLQALRLPSEEAELGADPPAGEGRVHAEPRATTDPPTDPGPAAAAGEPLSSEQRRFWFLEQVEGGNPAYHLFAAAHLAGDLDADVLERSVAEVVRRHDAVRASFDSVEGEPRQVIAPPMPVSLAAHDLRPRAAAEREAELHRLVTTEIRRPFDLGRPPLLRGVLVRLGNAEHVFVLIVHHIAAEAAAMTLLVREIMTLYPAFLRGRPSPFPTPSVRYAEYVRSQEERLTEQVVASQRAYWKRQLDGAASGLPVSTDRARPAEPDFQGRRHHFELSRELSDALRDVARSEGATLFMVLLAAFQTLLHRYSGETDISVGTPVSTRDQPGLKDLVGCCMNTLVLRSDLSGDPTFRALLQRVRKTALGAFEHQDLPFDQVVEALRPQREVGRSPLFRTMLVLHDARWPELQMGSLVVKPFEVDAQAAVSDLTLVVDVGERLHGALEYDTELFHASTISRMYAHFHTMLEGIAADPERQLSALPLEGAEDPLRRSAEWNDTSEAFPGNVRLDELFQTQAARTPDAIALSFDGEHVTYHELNRRANRLAGRLRGMGVGPEVVVGVGLERSPEAVVAALGVVKAGGAYLPVDPTHPEARLRFVLEDAGARVLVTRNGSSRTPSGLSAQVLTLESNGEGLDLTAAENESGGATPDHPAYVIYTSGSTGEPKGVVVTHRAICNQVQWRQRAFPLSDADAALLHSAFTFDPSVWEIFGPLCSGARLVLPPSAAEHDRARMVETIADEEVTVLQAVPSMLEALLEEPGIGRCRSLRHVFCGGEPLTPELQDRILAELPATLHHLYGPTEATIDTTYWTCSRGDDRPIVPIGRPIANVQVHILDHHLEPVPIGVPGELHIGGAGVARGYLNRPELTSERFIPDPFGGGDGTRLYRSGDRARWLPDGTVEFLGRLDGQVKVRGFRVECGEIEAALSRHPSVRQAAVVASGYCFRNRRQTAAATRQGSSPDTRLVAFVSARDGHASDADELSEFLRERLPEHMIPSAFATLEDLPRTPSGKVDRRHLAADLATGETSLPEPEWVRVAPRDAVELQLLGVWEGLFPGHRVGVTDDFFELGGHSLLAMRLAARLRRELGEDLPFSGLIQARTIEQQARLLRGEPRSRSPLIPIRPNGSGRPFFCVHPVGGQVVCYLELARWMGSDRPFYGLEARGLDGKEEPHARIEDMAADYLEAIRAVQPEGPYLLGGWSMGGVIAFEMARQLESRGERTAGTVLLDAGGSAEAEGLLRAFLDSLGLLPARFPVSMEELQGMHPDEQLALVLQQARQAKLIHPDMEVPGLRRQLRVFEANLRAMRSYEPGLFPGRILLIEATEPPGAAFGDAAFAWKELAGEGVTRTTVPGNHYTMLREPRAGELAGILSDHLERMDAADRG